MYRTILLPLDGSAVAERAVPYAGALAQASGARLLLLQATRTATSPGRHSTGEQAQAVHAARAYLAGVAAQLDRHTVAETVVFPAAATQAICEETQVRNVDLIVLTTHGPSGPGRTLYGSVAAQVVRRADVPVLLIPAAAEYSSFHGRRPRILVPVDGCDCTDDVLRDADELAAVLHAELLLLSVAVPSHGTGASASPPSEAAGETEPCDLEAIAAGLRAGGRAVAVRVAASRGEMTLATMAHEHGADMMALSTHACGGLPHQVSGRAVAGIIRHVSIPLLLVHPAAGRQPALQRSAAGAWMAGSRARA